MGFDVLYLPPIHPIGMTERKGPNNNPKAAAGRSRQSLGDRRRRGRPQGDSSASWARSRISSSLIAAAGEHGIEIALDIAFQMHARSSLRPRASRSGS